MRQEEVESVTQDVKPTFVGSQEEIELAGRVFELMLLQGRFYSSDHPIRQSLPELATFFREQGLHKDGAAVDGLIDAALSKNAQVFYREEQDGVVYFTTARRGSYKPVTRMRATSLPTITDRHMGRMMPAPALPGQAQRVVRKPDFVRREATIGGVAATLQTLLTATAPTAAPVKGALPIKEPPKARPAVPAAPAAPAPVKRVPQVETSQGLLINLSKSPADILAKYHDVFCDMVRDRIANDERLVSFGNLWMLAEKKTALAKGELRQVRDFIEASGGPETDESLCSHIFKKDVEVDPAFRFSLNYQLASEKKVFEFVGTNNQNLWWIAGTASPRILRAPLKPAEIGQDFKYLEDEASVSKLPGNKWVHTLTFYEWENGVLPYTPEAKLLLPPPSIKDQKIAQVRFEAPQFETSAYAEVHYPTGNRGGWIEGLAEILVVFVSGAKLTVSRNPDKVDTFSIMYDVKPVQETTVLLYDGKRQRFVFQPLPLSYQVDDTFLLERQRYGGLKDVRRLEEANRRKGDAVIIFAFEKVGVKTTREEKSVYRARLEDLLPIINIEKPFSKASLLRFFTTHPHYRKDESEEGYWVYIPD
jgi:hypothetical protein